MVDGGEPNVPPEADVPTDWLPVELPTTAFLSAPLLPRRRTLALGACCCGVWLTCEALVWLAVASGPPCPDGATDCWTVGLAFS